MKIALHCSGRPQLATDGEHIGAYDPALVETVLAEAAHLLRHLGFAAQHIVLIGGIVPSLLVLDPGAGRPHIGTGDLDLCLSMAIVEGDTGEYQRIEVALKKAGYTETDVSFRWRRTEGLGLDVEFFCPASPERPTGRMFRPKAAENPIAKRNFGSKLAALAIDAGDLIGQDVVKIEHQVTLPDGGGTTMFTFRVTGLLGFLIAKVSALTNRDKPKDAYDIVWILESWPGGPEAAADHIVQISAFGHELVAGAIEMLSDKFSTIDELGPSSYVRFLDSSEASGDDRTRWRRQAMGAVQEFCDRIRTH